MAERRERVEDRERCVVGDVVSSTLVATAPVVEPRFDECRAEIAVRADKPLHVGELAFDRVLIGGESRVYFCRLLPQRIVIGAANGQRSLDIETPQILQPLDLPLPEQQRRVSLSNS